MALAIPADGDVSRWTDREKALVEAAGLVSRGNLAPRPVVEAFLSHCHRTGLDPIARQIYCIERGGKWTTQISIDGARLVAERSKQYQGQTPVEWTADGVTWTQVWLSKDNPAAARVGVYRAGFQAPLFAVATWDAYNAGSPIWKKMPALMLGKCAEMLALRKAFPQDLSGLYSAEEMDQASTPAEHASRPQEAVQTASEVRAPSRDWLADANAATTYDELKVIFEQAGAAGDLAVQIADGRTLRDYLFELRDKLNAQPAEEPVDAEVVDDEPAGPVHVDDNGDVHSWPIVQPGEGGPQE